MQVTENENENAFILIYIIYINVVNIYNHIHIKKYTSYCSNINTWSPFHNWRTEAEETKYLWDQKKEIWFLLYILRLYATFVQWKRMLQDNRTKDQMIRQLNVHQCDWTSGTRPIMHFTVRIWGGIYTAHFHFHRHSWMQEKISPKKVTKVTAKIKVNWGLKLICLFNVHCIRELYALPCSFIYAHFTLFVR